MKPERWQQIKLLLQSVLEQEPNQRAAFLAAACASDESLRREVESLIISHDRAAGFIEHPAFEVMADSLAENQTVSLIGHQLDHYAIREQLGAGGMGEVYLAEDTRLGRKVALKLLPVFLKTEDDHVRRFQQEARAASALNHPNIITIYEIGQVEGRHFIATELIEGETLRQRMIKSSMSIAAALDVATQVASALVVAHQAGIAHRDIKPENIMLRADGIVKLLDFGLAKLVERKTGESEAATILQTKQGILMGTPHYMSPEQARGLTLDGRTDIWSLGVLLYEMVGGHVPFVGETSSDVIVSILEREPAPLARFTPETPETLQSVITKSLRKNVNQRYQTAKDLFTALKDLKDDVDLRAKLRFPQSSIPSVPPSSKSRPQTRYAKSGDVNIAYQVIGDGPVDLVYVMGWVSNLDYFWEEPSYARFLNRLASFSRLILFDKRGTGLSDRVSESELPTLEQRMDDVRAVMDAAGSEQAVVFGVSEGGPMAALFAATYPERASALVMYGSYAKRIWSLDYPWAPTMEERQKFFDLIAAGWGGIVDADIMAPSRADDEQFQDWWATYLRRSASPGAALAFAHMNTQIDITNVLPSIRVPTLIIHRTGDLDVNVGGARYMARQIAGAKYIELPGEDHLPFTGDQEAILAGIENFLTGIQDLPELDRVLATVLCFDLVDSAGLTEAANGEAFLEVAAREIERFRGRVLKTRNLHLASFDGPARAIRAACAIRDSARRFGAAIKAGLHTGECYLIDNQVAGIAVEMSAQIAERAERDEVLVSSTVKDLVAGSGLNFAERDVRQLGDSRGKWRLFAVAPDREAPTVLHAAAKPSTQRGKSLTSMAILPLRNESGDAGMEYLSDGITETLINTLSRVPNLRVMAWSTVSRYKSKEIDPRAIGQQLGARAVLTGRLVQVAERLTIKTELVDAADGSHLWGKSYSCKPSDIFDVQADISHEISEKLQLRLTTKEKHQLTNRSTNDVEAYHAYLKGRHFWNKRNVESLWKGIDYFKQSIDIDPSYAAAYAGLSDSYTLLAVREALPSQDALAKAKAAAERALKIDDTLAEAHASLGHALLHNFEWDAAANELKRSIELNPGYASAHHWYSEYLSVTGSFDEAITEARGAAELDPLSAVIAAHIADVLYLARRYDQAIEQGERALELEKSFWFAHVYRGKSYAQKQEFDKAISELVSASELSNRDQHVLALLGFVYILAGKKEDALKMLDALTSQAAGSRVPHHDLAILHTGLGDKAAAFDCLRQAFDEGAVGLFELKVEPVFDDLRSDLRFTQLLRKVGLATAEHVSSSPSIKTALKSTRPSLRRRVSRKAITSLAILPFRNDSGDADMEYLSDGVAENIIDNISQLSALRVMAWGTVARYKDRAVTPAEIGQVLGVRAVLSGSLRQVGERLIVRAELVDAGDGAQLWSDRYERNVEDVFKVQEQIARQISEKLRLKLTGEDKRRLARRRTESPAAFHLYLKGRYFWYRRTESDLKKGIEYFNQAIAEDPAYAAAYDGLSDSYALLALRGIIPHREAFQKAKAAATKALEIDESLGEAHASLAHIRLHEWDWTGLEEEFKRALALNPANSMTYHWYSEYLTARGRNDESIEMMKKAKDIDPLSAITWAGVAARYVFARRYDEAIREIRLGLEVNPDHFLLHFHLAQALSALGMHEPALEAAEHAVRLSNRSTEALTAHARVLARAGAEKKARKLLADVIAQSGERYVSAYSVAKTYAVLRDSQTAFTWLEKAYDDRNPDLIELSVEPALDDLRADPRFVDLKRRVGLGPGV